MSRTKGNKGEDIAVRYLERSGAQVLHRNYYIRGGEIDVIFREGDTTVFCEVKLRASDNYGAPSESVDFGKQRRISKAALDFTSKNKKVDENYRFDIIEIIGGRVNHIKAAFDFIEPKNIL